MENNQDSKSFCFYSETMASFQPYVVIYEIDSNLFAITLALETFNPDHLFNLPSDIRYLGRGEVRRRHVREVLSLKQQLIKMAMDYIIHD